MEQSEVRKYIRKYGKYKSGKGRTAEYAVQCTVCGEELRSTDPEDIVIGMSATKRYSAVFWHEKCQGKIWESKIHWKEG